MRLEPSPYRKTRVSVAPLYVSAYRMAVTWLRRLDAAVYRISTLLTPSAGAVTKVTVPAAAWTV